MPTDSVDLKLGEFVMRRSTISIIALTAALSALTACSQDKGAPPPDAAADTASDAAPAADSASRADQVGPGISGTVAPGVAFAYTYAFTLPAKAIARIQQDHAAACERLGPRRCRVTDMAYRQPDADSVEAKLSFLLAPDLANRFSSEGIAAVERAEGTLDNADISGQNAGGAIELSQSDSAAIAAEVARIEGRLRASGLTAPERTQLQSRIAELRDQIRGQAAERRNLEASLATTPVQFSYSSEGILAASNTFGKAASASWSSATSALSLALLIAGIALPWLALMGLGIFAVRWFTRRRRTVVEPTAAQ
jgi:hypothetical protein